MNTLLLLIPVSLIVGLVALGAFMWAMRSGQFDDLEGAAHRILFDDADNPDEQKTGAGKNSEASDDG